MDHRERPLVAACLLLVLALGPGCSVESDRQPADSTLPVPEGAPAREYTAVPLEGRDPVAVQMIEDLVIGADPSDAEAILYQPVDVAAAPDGSIFVADAGANDIKMFDADGNWLQTLGREGQGPGEFGRVSQVTVAGDGLVIWDSRNRRFSIWTFTGEHVADHAPGQLRTPSSVQGLGDGTLVWYVTELHPDGSRERVVARVSTDGTELDRLAVLPAAMPTLTPGRDPSTMLQDVIDSMDAPRLSFRVDGTGEVVYVTTEQEYAVSAMSPAGMVAWTLRVDWPRLPWPEARKQSVIDSFARSYADAADTEPDELDWPEHSAALLDLNSDGAGRLYVFLNPGEMDPDLPPSWPVDVYSPSGEYLASGAVPYRWSHSRGEYVYGLRRDDNDEMVVVHYRLRINTR